MSPTRHGRAGITLTEILISILIMGIGLVSLATLFPLGLMRLRDAQYFSRSSLLSETAASDAAAQNLFHRNYFAVCPYYGAPPVPYAYNPYPGLSAAGYSFYDPWLQDTPLPTPPNPPTGSITPSAVYRGNGMDGASSGHPGFQPFIPGAGLPVAFDPLWYAQLNASNQLGANNIVTPANGIRFGSGIGFMRNEPTNGVNSQNPSAYGLPRITSNQFLNLISSAVLTTQPLNYNFSINVAAPDVFVSHDDLVLQRDENANQVGGTALTGANNNIAAPSGAGSPILPYLNPTGSNTINPQGQLVYDWTYSWMFTGQRSDVSNETIFDGDIVVFHNRPFGLDPIIGPNSGGQTVQVPTGERVVEAIFAFGTTVQPAGASVGYSPNSQTVLLRWAAAEPDPDIRVGGWIADVTYERVWQEEQARFGRELTATTGAGFPVDLYPLQRCHWYRIVKRNDAQPSATVSGAREIIVTVDTPVRARTLLNSGGTPFYLNAALISPYVINVFPKVFYNH